MKKVLQHFFGKMTFMVSLLCAFAYTGNSQATYSLSTANCTILPNEVQMDLLVTNTSATNITIRWNSITIRMTVPASMLPSPITNGTYGFQYLGGSDFPNSWPVAPANAGGASFNTTTRLLTWTTGTPGNYTNANCPGGVAVNDAKPILQGQTKVVGRFSFKRLNGDFIAGQSANFVWSTTTNANFYVECAGSVSSPQLAVVRNTPCALTVPSACAVMGSSVVTDPACFGGTGSAVVTLTGAGAGAPGTYQVDGAGPNVPFATNPFTVSGLSGGPHNIVATVTAGGCISTPIAANVTVPTQLVASSTAGTIACFGGTTTVTVSATGGTAPYSGTGPQTVSAGSYSFTVTDANGCTSVTTGSISQPAALTGSGTATAVSCVGSTDGTATITLSTSTSGTYTVDGGIPQSYNSNPFTVSGLGAGPHTIVATSAAGCVSNLIGVSVGNAAALTGTATSTATTCGNPTSGTITVTLSGSTSGTYSLDGGPATPYNSNPFTITGVTGGPHTVVATSAAGCVSNSIAVTVGSTAVFTATVVKTNITACNVGNDGTITVTPNGGQAPYTYVWSGGYPGFAPGNVASVTNLPIGFYNVTVTSAGGCGTATFTNIHVQFAFLVYVTNSGTASSSCGNTGTITLFGNAGVLPYTYSLNGITYQVSNTFTGLAAGSYTGYVKDAGGCVSTKAITVSATSAVVANPFAVASSSCNADGSIQIFKSGGVGPFTYSLNAGAYQSSNFFPGLAAGPYTANVKDGNGCIGSAPVTVAQGAALVVTALKTNTSSCVNNGTIQVNASGGVAAYSYSINGGLFQASNTFSGLGAGTYAITVKDSKNCTGGPINVTINTNTIVVTATAVSATTCSSNNGKIYLFRTGGTGPFTYSINGNTYQSSNTFLNVAAGTYDGYVKDAFGCIGVLVGIFVGPVGCPPPPIAANTKYAAAVATSASLKVNAYPNPSSTGFTVQLDGYNMSEKVSVTVTDLLGRKVYQTEGTGKQQYRFGAGFIKGMYNVQVIQGADKKSLKLVKE